MVSDNKCGGNQMKSNDVQNLRILISGFGDFVHNYQRFGANK